MDREILRVHLKQAERHVVEGEGVLKHQRYVLEQLRHERRSDYLIDAAERLLRSFEEVQRMHLADAARLRSELATPT